MYGEEEPTSTKDEHGNTIYPYFRVSPNEIIRYSKYIGEGESFVIERKLGKDKSGWVPYCQKGSD